MVWHSRKVVWHGLRMATLRTTGNPCMGSAFSPKWELPYCYATRMGCLHDRNVYKFITCFTWLFWIFPPNLEKKKILRFPGQSLLGRPSWKGTIRNSSGSLCLRKYLHIILAGGAFSPHCWEGWEIEEEALSHISVHPTVFCSILHCN